jgi:methionyl-tRNA formyltransferase
MKLVFCGTPQFAVPTLQAVIAAGHEVALVLSQPDRPVGRKGEIHPTPVKQVALAHNIPVEQPEKLKNNIELRTLLDAIAPDVILVVAYGRIIPRWMLDLPRFGNINLHGSLLPRWRGAAPIQWAVAAGDAKTGVTTMLLNEGLDTGEMLLKCEVPIGADTTSAELFETLAPLGADLMLETLRGLEAGTLIPQPQNDAEATLAPILTRDDGHIDCTQPAQTVYNRFRGFQPWPGAWAMLRGKKIIVHAMHLASELANHAPGALFLQHGELRAACANSTAIVLDEIQVEGKKRMTATEFLRGFQLQENEQLT